VEQENLVHCLTLDYEDHFRKAVVALGSIPVGYFGSLAAFRVGVPKIVAMLEGLDFAPIRLLPPATDLHQVGTAFLVLNRAGNIVYGMF
jgi:hypothetical protein